MKHIYIIRHGETDFNRQGIVQGGGIDSHINEVGQVQALRFFEKYKHIPFDKIYTSALQRTVQTVSPFLQMNIPYEKLPQLNEISWGINEGRKIENSPDTFFYKLINDWKNGILHSATEQGESPLDVQKRLLHAMDYILKNEHEKNVLLCTHGRTMRILLSTILNTELHLMDQYEHQNVCLYMLSYQENKFELIRKNDTSHL